MVAPPDEPFLQLKRHGTVALPVSAKELGILDSKPHPSSCVALAWQWIDVGKSVGHNYLRRRRAYLHCNRIAAAWAMLLPNPRTLRLS
jgi:hypothetical protein